MPLPPVDLINILTELSGNIIEQLKEVEEKNAHQLAVDSADYIMNAYHQIVELEKESNS